MGELDFDKRQQEDAQFTGLFQRKTVLHDSRSTSSAGKLVNGRAAQLAKKPNNTGLPDNLKHGIESLSGMSMDNVKVHYNSSKPTQLNAHAYAQGTDIHLAPGQEMHLPHEAWHVVQQAQGRVRPTMQMKDSVSVNDDKGLEQEATLMGNVATTYTGPVQKQTTNLVGYSATQSFGRSVVQRFDWLSSTPLATLSSFAQGPSWKGAKDIADPRRWRLNPLNIISGVQNYREETAVGSNYHSSSKHGAHNTISNAMARLMPAPAPGPLLSGMRNKYTGGLVDYQPRQGRFNSEAWEAYAWQKAKQLFLAGLPPGTLINWHAGPPAWATPANRSTWRTILEFPNEDVGLSGVAMPVGVGLGGIQSVSGVMVAINYVQTMGPVAPGAVPAFIAWNGQMFPSHVPVGPAAAPLPGGIAIGPVIPGGAGVVRAGHPASAHNGNTVVVMPPAGVLAKIGFRLGIS